MSGLSTDRVGQAGTGQPKWGRREGSGLDMLHKSTCPLCACTHVFMYLAKSQPQALRTLQFRGEGR